MKTMSNYDITWSVKAKIYLSCSKRPYVMLLSSDKKIDDLFQQLNTNKVVRFGNLIFATDQLKRIELVYRQ